MAQSLRVKNSFDMDASNLLMSSDRQR